MKLKFDDACESLSGRDSVLETGPALRSPPLLGSAPGAPAGLGASEGVRVVATPPIVAFAPMALAPGGDPVQV